MRRRKRRARKPLLLTLAVVIGAAVVLGAYLASTAQRGLNSHIDKPVPQSVISSLSAAAHSSYGPSNQTLNALFRDVQGLPLMKGDKPIVLYLGADYCPFCASQRWPLILALMRFGNFSDLYFMASGPTDVFPNTPTFTFAHSSYTSEYVEFQAYETQDRDGRPLQSLPSNYSSISRTFNGNIPLLDIGNRYVMLGSAYSPSLLAGKNWSAIVNDIQSGQGVGVQIKQEANALTAAFCKVTGDRPPDVCEDQAIKGLSVTLASTSQSDSSAALTIGIPIASARAWASVQYVQMALSTNTSMKIR